MEEIDSLIELENYSEIEIKQLIIDIINIADEEIERTAEEAVREATSGLIEEINVLKKNQCKLTDFVLTGACCLVGGLLLGIILN